MSANLFLPKIQPGEQITASFLNGIIDRVNAMAAAAAQDGAVFTSAGVMYGDSSKFQPKFVELDNDIEALDRNRTGNRLTYNASHNDKFVDNLLDVYPIGDNTECLHLEGERHMVGWDASSGQYVPFPGMQIHLAKLDEDLDAGECATASVWEGTLPGWSPSSPNSPASPCDPDVVWADSTRNVKVWGWDDKVAIGSGTVVFIFLHRQSRKWVVLRAGATGGVARVTEAIDAAFGTDIRQFGSGKADIYTRNPLNFQSQLLEEDVTIWNSTTQTTLADKWIQFKVDTAGDYWWDVDDCEETGSPASPSP